MQMQLALQLNNAPLSLESKPDSCDFQVEEAHTLNSYMNKFVSILIQLKISFCGSICSLSVLSSRSVGGTD